MQTPGRRWHLALIAAGLVAGLWLLTPRWPAAPDFTAAGFTAVRVELPARGEAGPAVVAEFADPAVIAGLTDLIRTGRPVPVCRCAALGRLEFVRPDGTAERVLLMPAHDPGTVEFRPTRGRFRVDRELFLRVVAPLAVPADRWHSFPDP